MPSCDGIQAVSNREVCHDCYIVRVLLLLSRVSARLPVRNQEVGGIFHAAVTNPPRGFISESA